MAALLREPGYSDHKLVVLDIAEPLPFIYEYATKDNQLFVKTDLSNKAGKTRFVNIQGKVFSILIVSTLSSLETCYDKAEQGKHGGVSNSCCGKRTLWVQQSTFT